MKCSILCILSCTVLCLCAGAQTVGRDLVDIRDYGAKCDGTTDDSAALAAALVAGSGKTIYIPPGTCIVNPSSGSFQITNSTSIGGAGEYLSILKISNGANTSNSLLLLPYPPPNQVTISDFTIDGNRQNQNAGGDLIVVGTSSKITLRRMHLMNAYADAFGCFAFGANYCSDISIIESDFENNTVNASQSQDDVRILQPVRVKILHNRFLNSTGLASIGFSSNTGVGQVEIGDNTFTGFTGYAVALGGGANNNARGANIHDNTIDGTSSNQNLIDLAAWSDIQVHHNYFPMTGLWSAIGDLPPANRVVVDGNVIYGNPGANQATCIGLGGSDLAITNNYCSGAGDSGIAIAVSNTGPTKHVIIANNVSKNNNQFNPSFFTKAGIELFLAPGGTASLSDVTIKGNHVYDDQASQTQWYGIEIANSGQSTGFGNIVIESNDVNGNKTAGLRLGATDMTNSVIRGNLGWNPVGVVTAPPFPASGVAVANTTSYDVTVYIVPGNNPITQILIGGTALLGVTVPGGDSVPIHVPANQTITLIYEVGGTPAWQWIAD